MYKLLVQHGHLWAWWPCVIIIKIHKHYKKFNLWSISTISLLIQIHPGYVQLHLLLHQMWGPSKRQFKMQSSPIITITNILSRRIVANVRSSTLPVSTPFYWLLFTIDSDLTWEWSFYNTAVLFFSFLFCHHCSGGNKNMGRGTDFFPLLPGNIWWQD